MSSPEGRTDRCNRLVDALADERCGRIEYDEMHDPHPDFWPHDAQPFERKHPYDPMPVCPEDEPARYLGGGSR